ncbi:MAG: transcriptional repressor [Tissierellia bacterium]|nr:transcriptional repressor [Tissierellia bacterium]
MTKQRNLILQIIRESNEHLNAEEIYLLAKMQMPSIAIGTVYRNLNLMVDAGEINRLHIPKEPDRFDRNIHRHDHLICERCGDIRDVKLADPMRMEELLKTSTGEEISSYDLTIYYVCEKCRAH